MAKMRIRRFLRMDSEINVASMSDISFILIIFFMVTAVFTLKDGLHLALPDKNRPPVVISARNVVTVTLSESGGITCRDREVDREALSALLADELRGNPGLVVLAKIARGVSYEKAVDLVDRIQFAGVRRLTIRTI